MARTDEERNTGSLRQEIPDGREMSKTESASQKKMRIFKVKVKRYLKKKKKTIRFWAITLSIALVVTVVLSVLAVTFSEEPEEEPMSELRSVSVELDEANFNWNIVGSIMIGEQDTIVKDLCIRVGGNAVHGEVDRYLDSIVLKVGSSTGSNAYLAVGDWLSFNISVKGVTGLSVEWGEQMVVWVKLFYRGAFCDMETVNVDEYYITLPSGR